MFKRIGALLALLSLLIAPVTAGPIRPATVSNQASSLGWNKQANNPSWLFAAGEQGFWYDPSDLSAQFQDVGGTTAAAVGQPTGLVLDKSKGLVLGPELRGNGAVGLQGAATAATFNTSTGAGTLTRVDGSNQSYVTWTTLASGAFYKITITNTGAVGLFLRTGGIASGAPTFVNPSQTITAYIPASGNSITISALANGSGAFTIVSFKSIAGNHITAPAATNRPTHSRMPAGGVRNIISNSAFSGGISGSTGTLPTGWSSSGVGTPPVIYAASTEFGGQSFSVTTSNSSDRFTLAQGFTGAANTTYTASVVVDFTSGTGVQLFQLINWVTTPAGSTVTYLLDGASVAGSISMPTGRHIIAATVAIAGTGGGLTLRIGSGTSQVVNMAATFYAPQFELGSARTAYQRVTSAYDVTQAGIPDLYYWAFDGTDDYFVSGNIDFSGSDKIAVWAAVRKTSDAALAFIAELSASAAGNAGTFSLTAPQSASASFGFNSRGTSASLSNAVYTNAAVAAPYTAVLSGIADIGGDTAKLRVNGVQSGLSTTDQGTGNFGSYPLYVGRRGGSSNPLSGNIFGLIGRLGAANDNQIASPERWLASKSGVNF